jgi:hypothetical protein
VRGRDELGHELAKCKHDESPRKAGFNHNHEKPTWESQSWEIWIGCELCAKKDDKYNKELSTNLRSKDESDLSLLSCDES